MQSTWITIYYLRLAQPNIPRSIRSIDNIYTGTAVTPCHFLAEDASAGFLGGSIYVRSAAGTAVDEDTYVHQYQLLYDIYIAPEWISVCVEDIWRTGTRRNS